MRRFLALALLASASPAAAQQVADTAFSPPLVRPAWAAGAGPRVLLDEAHVNFHTVEGRYSTFVKLLRRDGFVVEPNRAPFSRASLAPARILVIANALNPKNQSAWTLPTPSAFTKEEIAAVREWVREGGSLFLIADHMPFPGAAADLAAEFGVFFMNGFATDSAGDTGPMTFRRREGYLGVHPVTRGIDSVTSFTGQAFRIGARFTPILVLRPGTQVLLPVTAWQFSDSTQRLRADGLVQGAVGPFGKGRVAVFGEAAMFSAQLGGANRTPMGMNAPVAAQNPKFLLALVHWLAGL